MATTAIKIQTEVNTAERYINVTDITSYDTDERIEYGFAVFITKDGSVVDGSLTDYTFETWSFEISSAGQYLSKVYAIPIYDSAFSYNTGEIVIAPPTVATTVGGETNWGFYRSQQDGHDGHNPADDDGTYWVQITTVDDTTKGYFDALVSRSTYNPMPEESSHDAEDLDYVITKQSCNVYEINNASSTVYFDIYEFTDYINDGEALNTSRLTLTGSADTTLDLTDYDVTDGVYVLVLFADATTLEEDGYLVIYEYCEAKACFKSLIENILCCDDGECSTSSCNGTAEYEMDQKCKEALRLVALFQQFLGYVFSERTKYIYMTSLEDDRRDLINSADNIMTKLKELVERCGEC